jgi:hypothetical protein
MAGGQTLLWQEVKHSYGSKTNTLIAKRKTLLWQQVKNSILVIVICFHQMFHISSFLSETTKKIV